MKGDLKIAILDMYDNYANEGMRCIRQLVGGFIQHHRVPGTFEVFNVRGAGEVPGLEYDVYISSGGPGSPLPGDSAWEKRFFDLVDAIFAHNRYHERKKYLFLICHSFQMVALHLGLAVVSKRKSTSFGVMPVHRTQHGFRESFFRGLPEPFYVVDSRDYQVVAPNYKRIKALGARVLALEKIRPHIPLERAIMAIRFSREVFGTQFHPEADSEGMLHYFLTAEKKQIVINNHGEEKYYEVIERLDDPDKISLTVTVILPNFLENAAFNLLEPIPVI
jgi:GMP synthase-like glutamine amidotransferase